MTNKAQDKFRFSRTLALAGAVAATLFAASSPADADVFGFLDPGVSVTALRVPGASQTYANGINDAGQIVGWYDGSTGRHGFLYSGGSFTQIDVPGHSSTQAFGINDVERLQRRCPSASR